MTLQGKIVGTTDAGACGTIPVIAIDAPKPTLRNNGYACYGGHPQVHVPGLAAMLPREGGASLRQGHALLTYSDGQQFQTYVDNMMGDTIRPS